MSSFGTGLPGRGAATDPDALAGLAQITSVRDTGMTINNHNAVFELRVIVTVGGQAPYEGLVRVALGRAQWGALQPGMTVPVRVDRRDPSKIAVDPTRPVLAAGGLAATPAAAPSGTGAAPGYLTMPGGSAQVTTVSAADLIARGVPATGLLLSVAPTGMTAGQATAGLAPELADDPIVHAVFSYVDHAGQEHRKEALHRVPDGKAVHLDNGATIPVAYLRDDPTQATIDWTRL